MAFYEIGKGKFAKWMQEEFDRAQKIAHDTGDEVKIAVVITVRPSKEDSRFGQVSFNVKASRPAKKSMDYATELDDNGVMISDGESIADVLQIELKLPEVGKKKEGTNG